MALTSNNFQYGPIGFKCYINRNIPMMTQRLIDVQIPLNLKTLSSFSSDAFAGFLFVKGLPGIFLKQKYMYKSTFLADLLGKYVQSTLLKEYNARSTSISSPTDFSSKNPLLYLPDYYALQLFNILWSVLLDISNADNKPVSLCQTQQDNSMRSTRAIWGNSSYNQSGDGDPKKKASTASKLTLRQDGNINFITQGNKSTEIDKGVHWRVVKDTPLFFGQDFFVTIKRTSPATDVTKGTATTAFKNATKKYLKALDVNLQTKSSSGSQLVPVNSGVVQYKLEMTSDGKIKYTVHLLSKLTYNFNDQVYYVLAMTGLLLSAISIVITQRGFPRCVLVRDNKSYVLGQHNIKGDTLIKGEYLTITVRNHLGNLVVVFNKDQSNPWIIRPLSSLGSNTLKSASLTGQGGLLALNSAPVDFDKLIIVPNGPLLIWGGNVSASINYSPLTYSWADNVAFPPQKKDPSSKGKANSLNYYLTPKLNESIIFTLSDVDPAKLDSASQTQQVYSCDAHRVALNMSDVSLKGYMTTGKFLRDFESGVLSSVLSLTKQKILIEGTLDGLDTDKFTLNLLMFAGDYKFSSSKEYLLLSCLTPIATSIRFISKPKQDQPSKVLDVSRLVTLYSDTWTSSDYQSAQHTGRIKFLINLGMTGNAQCKDTDISLVVDSLVALQKRGSVFFILIYAGFNGDSCKSPLDKIKGCAKLGNLAKMFTGMCFGASISFLAGKRFMTAEIVDYSKILLLTLMFNSPYYDGVRDINVIYDMVQMSGMGMKNNQPGWILKNYIDNGGNKFMGMDERSCSSKVYVLPNSYAKLTNPFYKFLDGSKFWENMIRIAKQAGKVLFFDTCGYLHYDILPYSLLITGSSKALVKNDWCFSVDPCKSPPAKVSLAFDSVLLQRDVSSVHNVIHLVTSSPQFELNINDFVNKPSIVDPDSLGYVGYKKIFFQQDGIFGNAESLKNLSLHYKKFLRAPVVLKWKSIGTPVRALDVCSLDGQQVIAINVTNTISAQLNSWVTDILGLWFHGLKYERLK